MWCPGSSGSRFKRRRTRSRGFVGKEEEKDVEEEE